LQSFKAFDDGVSSVHPNGEQILVGMADRLITLSKSRMDVTKEPSLLLGIMMFESKVQVATKAFDSISIRSFNSTRDVFQTSDSCSAFFSDVTAFIFWFGFRDGSILQYSASKTQFNLMVFQMLN
jgi:hypothetical protein